MSKFTEWLARSGPNNALRSGKHPKPGSEIRLVEFDGKPISSARRLEIQVAVLNAIEPARRTVPPAT